MVLKLPYSRNGVGIKSILVACIIRNILSNSILDPLSYVYEGRTKISESKSTESLEYSDDFAPNYL